MIEQGTQNSINTSEIKESPTPSERTSALQASSIAKHAGLIEEDELTPEEIAQYVKLRTHSHEGDHLVLAGILTGERQRKIISSFYPFKPASTPEAETTNMDPSHKARIKLLQQNRS